MPFVRGFAHLVPGLLMWPLAAQEWPASDSPLMASAWEQGCITAEEATALSVLLLDGDQRTMTQQRLASVIPPERQSDVWACLRGISGWRDLFRAALDFSPVREVDPWRFRWDARQVEPASWQGRVMAAWRYRSDRLRMDAAGQGAEGGDRWAAAHIGYRGRRGDLSLGSLSGRFGQGLVVWTPGPFDDLGGVEGSHRIATGIQPATVRQRGVVQGVGWKASQGKPWSPDWLILGRTWPDHLGMWAGGGKVGRLGWALRCQERIEGGWGTVFGLDGGGEWKGWSGRWSLAAFHGGWIWRGTLLRTWSEHWEGHVLWVRDHPGHPRWHDGSQRATLPDPEEAPSRNFIAGLAHQGSWRGWVRVSIGRAERAPMWELRRTAARLEWGRHRWEWRSSWRWGEGAGPMPSGGIRPEWSGSWRWSGTRGARAKGHWNTTWMLTGRGDDWGVLFTWMGGWEGEAGGRVRLGAGQMWGSPQAPLAMARGWNGRPAEAFSIGTFKFFLMWRPAGGHWNGGLTIATGHREGLADPVEGHWAIHSVRVEFRP